MPLLDRQVPYAAAPHTRASLHLRWRQSPWPRHPPRRAWLRRAPDRSATVQEACTGPVQLHPLHATRPTRRKVPARYLLRPVHRPRIARRAGTELRHDGLQEFLHRTAAARPRQEHLVRPSLPRSTIRSRSNPSRCPASPERPASAPASAGAMRLDLRPGHFAELSARAGTSAAPSPRRLRSPSAIAARPRCSAIHRPRAIRQSEACRTLPSSRHDVMRKLEQDLLVRSLSGMKWQRRRRRFEIDEVQRPAPSLPSPSRSASRRSNGPCPAARSRATADRAAPSVRSSRPIP